MKHPEEDLFYIKTGGGGNTTILVKLFGSIYKELYH